MTYEADESTATPEVADTSEPVVTPAVAIGDGRLLDSLVRRWTAIGTLVSVGAFWMMATLGRPWRLFADTNAFSQNFFDLQAESLLHGRLSVPAGSLSFEGFITPRGTFMYFGIVPAVLRMPIRLVTDRFDGRLGTASCLIAIAVLCIGTARLARRAQRHLGLVGVHGGEASYRWYALVAAAPVVCTPVLHLASRSMVYHEAIAWGAAGAVWGVDAAMQWWHERTLRRLAFVALAAVVAINARPSVGLVPMLAMAGFAAVLVWRRQWLHAVTAAGVAVVAFATYSLIDHARFGQWWGAPASAQYATQVFPEQAAAAAMTGDSLFSLRFVPTTFAQYLNPFRVDVVSTRLFPFVEFARSPRPIGGVPMQIGPSGSLLSSAPVVVLLALVGAVWVVRRGDTAWRTVAAACALATVATLGFWAVWHRYLVDFVPLLLVLAAPGLWLALRFVGDSDRWLRATIAAAVAVLALWGLAGQVGLAVWSRTNFYPFHEAEQAELTVFRYRLDGWLFDGPPPHVVRVDAASLATLPSGHQGDLAIVGDCDALYIDDVGWRPFEMPSGNVTAFCRTLLARLPD